MDGEKYISMFKINGIPILPPLMTAARRREMLAYKELAMALETRLKLEAKERKNVKTENFDSMATIEDEYLKVSSLLQDHFSPAKLEQPAARRRVAGLENPTEFLKKSDTFIYDINTNTVMIPTSKEVLVGCGDGGQCVSSSEASNKFSNACQLVGSNVQTKSPGRKPMMAVTKTLRVSSPIASCSSNTIKALTPDTRSIASQDKAPSTTSSRNDSDSKPNTFRASTSPALKDPNRTPPTPKLVRSNSFTLDSPSPVLLEHMVRSRGKNPDNSENSHVNYSLKELPKRTRLTRTAADANTFRMNSLPPRRPSSAVQKANSTLPSAPVAISPTPEQSKLGTLLVTNSTLFKNRKSPYEIRVTANKVQKKHRAPVKKVSSITIKPRLSHHRSRLLVAGPCPKPLPRKHIPPSQPAEKSPEHRLRAIEEQHRLKLMELVKRQQEVQRQMQEQFERQQQRLLEEFSVGLESLRVPSTTSIDYKDESVTMIDRNNDRNNNNDDGNGINSSKASQASLDDVECYDMTETMAASTNFKNTPRCSRRLFETGGGQPPPPTPRRRSLPKTAPVYCGLTSPTRRREDAATQINAYVRGYLVRRLFRTEHVQQIVQTIQDTLYFALQFHRETRYDMTKENITLKARLLQQLTSACHSLKAVFNLPIKERMQIIARDRIYRQTKAKAREKYINYKSPTFNKTSPFKQKPYVSFK